MQELRYLRSHGSQGAQVVRLMGDVERQTDILKNYDAVVNNPENFPNQVANSSTQFVRRLLDVI